MTDHLNYYSPQEFYDSSSLISNSIKLEDNHQSNLISDMDSSSNNPMLTTASMPIPHRGTANNRLLADLSEYVFDLETSQSPQLLQDISNFTNNTSGGTMFELQSPEIALNSGWPDFGGPQNISVATKQEYLMEEEDIFQVDKADLIQGPTLAELNADNLYVDLLNIDEIIAADQMSPHLTTLETHFNPNGAIQSSPNVPIQIFSPQTPQTPNNSLQSNPSFYDDQTPTTSNSLYDKYHSSTPTNASINNSSSSSPITPPPPSQSYYTTANTGNVGVVQHNPKFTTLHELLMKKNDALQYRRERQLGQSVPGGSTRPVISPGRKLLANLQPNASRLSSSAPTHLGLEQIWQRREPRPHLLSTGNSSSTHKLLHDDERDDLILGSLAEAGSTSSLSTGGVLSPEAPDFSQDEGYSDDDSDEHYDDFSSDNGKHAKQFEFYVFVLIRFGFRFRQRNTLQQCWWCE